MTRVDGRDNTNGQGRGEGEAVVSELQPPAVLCYLYLAGAFLVGQCLRGQCARHMTSVRVLESTFFRGKRIGEEEVEDSHDVTYGTCWVKELCTEDGQ